MNRLIRSPESLPMDVVAKRMLTRASYSMRRNCVVMIQKKNLTPSQQKNTSTIKRPQGVISKSLPHHQIHIHLSDEEKAGAIDTFYSVVKEEPDIEPVKTRVIEYLQEKVVFVEKGTCQIKAEKRPKHPLPKVIASAGLRSFIIVFKILRWPTTLSSEQYYQALRR